MPRAQPSPANSPSPPPRQNKVYMQRQYREKESECFAVLRGVVKRLTGEELQTRQEILKKATDLLVAEIRKQEQEQAQFIPPAQYDAPATTVNVPTDTELTHLGYPVIPAHSSNWVQPWESTEFDCYTAQSHGQQYYPMSNMDAGFDQTNHQEFSTENWPNDHHF